jgi:hypothetical protein
MLITFRSKASPDVMMYKEHARRILDLLGKDADRGVITAAEAPKAVETIEKEISESRHATTEVEQDVRAHGDDDKDHEAIETVSFSTRAYPLLEMLRQSRDLKCDVMWGVL